MTQATPKHLALLRERFKITQAQAAEHAGVTRVTWCRWETGAAKLPRYVIHILRSIARELQEEKADETIQTNE